MQDAIYKDIEIYSGLDIHKKSWELTCVSKHVILKRIHMNEPSSQKVAQFLRSHYPQARHKCVYEAGFSGYWLQEELTELGIETIVVHPGDVPTTDKEKRIKNDQVDAKKLALSLRSGQLSGIYIPPKYQQKDRSLVRQRYQYASDERRLKNRIKSHLNFYGIGCDELDSYWSKNYLIQLKALSEKHKDEVLSLYLDKLEGERKYVLQSTTKLRRLSRTERYRRAVELLRSIPGVGLLTAMVYLTEIGNEVSRFKKDDQYISYIGFVPSLKATGEKYHQGSLSKRGNKRLRTAIILSAWMAVRNNAEMLKCYEQYKSAGKPSNKAIIKIARKLALIMKAVLRDGIKYGENKK